MLNGRRWSARFCAYAWAALLLNIAVILWGGYVRASDSGNGCGDHWPLCNGAAIPHSPAMATVIEFMHRVSSGIALMTTLGLFLFAFVVFPRKHLARLSAVAAMFFIVMEALIGAAIVLLRQTGSDSSIGRGVTLSVHLVNTLMLLAALATAGWAGSSKDGWLARGLGARWTGALTVCAVLLLVLGVSGAIAALGDTLFRSSSLAAGLRQDFSANAPLFLRLRIWHPGVAVVSGGAVIGLAAFALRWHVAPAANRFATALIGLTLAQFALGLINLAMLAPIPLQLAHLALADGVWICFVLFGLNLLFVADGSGIDSVAIEAGAWDSATSSLE